MIHAILGIPEQHGVATPAALEALHVRKIEERQAIGMRVTVSTSRTEIRPYVDLGRWVADCPCGAGIAVEPTWPEARCFGCGTVYTQIAWPDATTRRDIEQTLLARRTARHRNWHWQEGETLADLTAENAARPDLVGPGGPA